MTDPAKKNNYWLRYDPVLIFKKSIMLATRSAKCTSKHCGGSRIVGNQKYWRSCSKNSAYVLCQKCFGFWLARYNNFDYDPFHIDAVDLKWERHWGEEIKNYAAEIFVENMIKQDVQIA